MTALAVSGPHIDWAGLSPLVAVFAGALVVSIARRRRT
jgi:hypothetical protein